jgi:hypothetical protein
LLEALEEEGATGEVFMAADVIVADAAGDEDDLAHGGVGRIDFERELLLLLGEFSVGAGGEGERGEEAEWDVHEARGNVG